MQGGGPAGTLRTTIWFRKVLRVSRLVALSNASLLNDCRYSLKPATSRFCLGYAGSRHLSRPSVLLVSVLVEYNLVMGALFSALSPRTETCDASVEDVAQLLASASNTVCLTGAGISAESGIPTFRDPADGLWKRYECVRSRATRRFSHASCPAVPRSTLQFGACRGAIERAQCTFSHLLFCS